MALMSCCCSYTCWLAIPDGRVGLYL